MNGESEKKKQTQDSLKIDKDRKYSKYHLLINNLDWKVKLSQRIRIYRLNCFNELK